MSKTIKMVKQENGTTISADVHPDEVDNYRSGGWVLDSGKTWTDGTTKEDQIDDLGDQIKAVSKMKKADLEAFVAEQELEINLDDFSNMQKRKAAVIEILEA